MCVRTLTPRRCPAPPRPSWHWQDVVRLEQALHDLMGRMTQVKRQAKCFSLPVEYKVGWGGVGGSWGGSWGAAGCVGTWRFLGLGSLLI